MPKISMSESSNPKLNEKAINRKQLIKQLGKVIRQKHKVQRQITRKYESYQFLEKWQENLKNRIRQLTTAVL